jgi:Nucleotidyl transferase AbiEii toxin, Type IV TA system
VSIELLELAAVRLEPLLGDIVFLGGAAVELWLTDPSAPPARPTKDVDVVVEVSSRGAFYAFEERLRALGFSDDREGGVICRWRHRETDLILDVMPSDPAILGFANRWQGASVPHAIERALPSGALIRAAPPEYLLATKIEAFNDRGRSDFLGSRDLADVIALIDGRAELVDEVRGADHDVRAFLREQLRFLTENPRFVDGVHAGLRPDAASQARGEAVVLPRVYEMIGNAGGGAT